jgi:hypothetical protein
MQGIVHGHTIELEDDPQIEDGSKVEVVVRQVAPSGSQPGEGFLRTEGALADYPEWDAIMEEIQRARKDERRPQWEDS